jgi:ribokinase
VVETGTVGPRILVVGSVNIDLVLRVDRHPEPGETVAGTSLDRLPGGKGGNQAAALARLGSDVALHGCVGADTDGRWSRDELAAAGVDVTALRATGAAPTGTAVVVVDAAGANRIVVVPGANAAVEPPDDPTGFDLLLTQLEVPLAVVEAAVSRASRVGVRVVLNAAPATPLPDGLLAAVDVLVLNETEARAIGGADDVVDAAQALRRRGVEAVVVTRGAAGALVLGPDDRAADVPAPRVAVVDTTGAGDCFTAALVHRLARGDEVVEAARFACTAAALSVRAAGARGGLPTEAEVRRAATSAASG